MKEPTAQFGWSRLMGDATVDGCDAATDAQLPRIPERYQESLFTDAWINGYLTELRHRMERGGMRP